MCLLYEDIINIVVILFNALVPLIKNIKIIIV